MSRWAPIEERLSNGLVAIPFSGCHIWIGPSVPCGYGVIHYKGRQSYVHRVAWELYARESPGDLFVCHRCDVPACANPNHLFLGTAQDNARDMATKGRANGGPPSGERNYVHRNPRIVQGENNGGSKITDEIAREIVRLSDSGIIHREIAEYFGIGRSTVAKIAIKKSWRHLWA